MKIGVSGKGGTGKTTISATLARCLADRDGRPAIVAAPDSPMVRAVIELADSLEGAWAQPLPR